jgi:hypothetical protein
MAKPSSKNKKSAPKKSAKGKGGKPTAKGTKSPKAVKPKDKKTRRKWNLVRPPVPSAGGQPNPLLISKRNKRALCVAFAGELGGAEGTPEQDELLMKAVRESGVLWKSAKINLENFLDEKENEHVAEEQSGRGYAMNTGRKMFESYTEAYPDKVEACKPFAVAFLKLIQKKEAAYETARQKEVDGIDKIREKIVKQQAAEAAAKKSKKKATAKPKKTPAKGKKVLKKSAGKPSAKGEKKTA